MVKKVQIVHPWSFATTLFSVFKFFHKCMGKYHRIYVFLLCVEFNFVLFQLFQCLILVFVGNYFK